MAAVLPMLPERHRAAPKPALLWTLGVAAVASCAVTVVLASLNEELYQPALRVLLVIWSHSRSSSPGSWHGEGGLTAPSGHC